MSNYVSRTTIRQFAHEGFTLIELLVVLTILGLLAGIAGPRVIQYLGGAKVDTAALQIEEFGAGLDLFHLEVGRYPTSEEGLEVLTSAPATGKGWNGPYLKKREIPLDPWGNNYIYRHPGQHGDYDLYSLGRDAVEGGEGEDSDIVSW